MLISLAWKNVWRNKKRSLIIVSAIAFGLWGGLLSNGVFMGMTESIVETAIKRDLAHIQIHKQGFLAEKTIQDFIPEGKKNLEPLKNMNGIDAVSSRTIIYGMAASPASSFGVKIVGIEPAAERQVSVIPEYIVDGDYFKSDRTNQVIVGQKLADRLNLGLRKKVILSFPGMDGEIIYLAVRIVGIYKTESSQFDEMNVFTNQRNLFRVTGQKAFIHEIAVRCESAEYLESVQADIKEKYPELDVQTWRQLAPEIAYLSEIMESFAYLFVAIILFALIFGITNTMLMSVLDRVRELGVLIAVGMKKGKVFIMILLETIFLSLSGGIIGMVIGSLSIALFSSTGIDLSAFAASLESFGSSTMLYPYLPAVMYIVLATMIVFAANIAAIMPAWKATHLSPSEAIRTY